MVVCSVAKLVCSLDDCHMDYLVDLVVVVGIEASLELDSKDCTGSFHSVFKNANKYPILPGQFHYKQFKRFLIYFLKL